jgi:hypothetical protein
LADKDFKVKAGLDLGTPLPLTEGGTGQTSASNALNAILPVQTSAANKFLQSDGTSTSWVAAAVVNNATFTGSSIVIPSGTSEERPASPVTGAIRLNTTSGTLEFYTGTAWGSIATFPQPPTSLVATNVGTSRAYNNGAASVAFTTASADGGSTITGYTITSNPGSFTATGSTSPIVVTGLQSATSYTFTGTATNSIGLSTVSSASSSITATTVPQAPTPGTATATNTTTASLPFTAGATGGSTITNYKYSTDGTTYTALSPAQTTSPLSISGLTSGTTYTFYIKAVNTNGDSAASTAYNSLAMPLPTAPSIEYIVLAGGGAGGAAYNSNASGGGGAGGMLTGNQAISAGTTYIITVGTGGPTTVGNANTGLYSSAPSGTAGNASSFGNLISTTGGGGGGGDALESVDNYGQPNWRAVEGGAGGSGGGGSKRGGGGYNGGSGIAGQGTSGGTGGSNNGGGGGGGTNAGTSNGAGGNGKSGFDSVVRAGGGGGGTVGSAGNGGGGAGGNVTGAAGSANLGGGGGGTGQGTSRSGGSGGSGIVKFRYASNYAAPNATNGSPTVNNDGGYRTYTFNGSGQVTF